MLYTKTNTGACPGMDLLFDWWIKKKKNLTNVIEYLKCDVPEYLKCDGARFYKNIFFRKFSSLYHPTHGRFVLRVIFSAKKSLVQARNFREKRFYLAFSRDFIITFFLIFCTELRISNTQNVTELNFQEIFFPAENVKMPEIAVFANFFNVSNVF